MKRLQVCLTKPVALGAADDEEWVDIESPLGFTVSDREGTKYNVASTGGSGLVIRAVQDDRIIIHPIEKNKVIIQPAVPPHRQVEMRPDVGELRGVLNDALNFIKAQDSDDPLDREWWDEIERNALRKEIEDALEKTS